MQPVRAPARRVAALALALLVLAGAAAAAALSNGPEDTAPSVRSPLVAIAGRPLQQASCEQWREGTPDEKNAVVEALEGTVGGPTPYGRGNTLSTADAFRLFDRACARPYATGFLLYEMYTRASAFQSTGQRFQ